MCICSNHKQDPFGHAMVVVVSGVAKNGLKKVHRKVRGTLRKEQLPWINALHEELLNSFDRIWKWKSS